MERQPHPPHVSCAAKNSQKPASGEIVLGGGSCLWNNSNAGGKWCQMWCSLDGTTGQPSHWNGSTTPKKLHACDTRRTAGWPLTYWQSRSCGKCYGLRGHSSGADKWQKVEESFKLWYNHQISHRCSLGTTLLKKYACHAKIQDGDHFFKMADMFGKDITKFAKKFAYLSNWDDGVKSYSLEHVEK